MKRAIVNKSGVGACLLAIGILGCIAIRFAFAASCTQGCGSNSHACAGTDNTACNTPYCASTGVGCNALDGGHQWYDPVIRGTDTGTSNIEMKAVDCYLYTLSMPDATYGGYTCNLAVTACWAPWPGGYCHHCGPSTLPWIVQINTCEDKGCKEE